MSNKSPKNISIAFDHCLQMIEKHNMEKGDCLKLYPQYTQELKELLNLTNAINDLKYLNPSENFCKNAQERITQALVDRPVTFGEYIRLMLRRKPYQSIIRFSITQLIVTLILLISLLIGGVHAADAAGPGDLLYGLDRTIDQVRLILVLDSEIKASTRLEYAAARIQEAKNEIENGELDNAIIAFKAYDHEIDKYTQMLFDKEEGTDRDKLETMLTEALNNHQSVLLIILEKVPPEAKVAIQNAMTASLAFFEIPLGPPFEITPGPPFEIYPGPPFEISPGPPSEITPGPPFEITPGPSSEKTPGPPFDCPPGRRPFDCPPGQPFQWP
jgi:hypothetical protein